MNFFSYIWVCFLIIGYGTAILLLQENRTDKIILAIDSLRTECFLPAETDSSFERYYAVDTTDYYGGE